MASKSVKIDFKTFLMLIRYFVLDEHTEELYGEIKHVLEDKVDSLARHELYTQSKTAETAEERERARQKYLDSVGMRDSFRY